MLSGPGSSNTLTRVATLVASAAISIFLFQNCGKSGFQKGAVDSSSAMSGAFNSAASADSKASAVFPVKANFNQIGYMSCPAAGAKPSDTVDPFADPFFNVRAGAYDNTRFAAVFPVNGLSDAEIKDRLVAGVGLTKEFNDYIDKSYRNPQGEDRKTALSLALTGSPYAEYQLAAGLINENNHRSTAQGDFGFDYSLMTGLLDSIGDSRLMLSYLKQPILDDNANQRQSFFGNLERGSQSMTASFSFGSNEVDIRDLTSDLAGNLVLNLGYTYPGENTEITQFLSPDGTDEKAIGKKLYGRAYKLGFSYEWPGTNKVRMPVMFPSGVTELDMTQTDDNKANLSLLEGQEWDCFALRIVRHIDRINPATKRPYSIPGTYAIRTANNVEIPNVKVACPTQRVDAHNATYTDSGNVTHTAARGIERPLNKVRLQMARRFLPAELWELNTDPDYLCAVPTEHAMDRGTCYASGDRDSSKFIQYDHDMKGKMPCGQGGNECPAYVTICYRTK